MGEKIKFHKSLLGQMLFYIVLPVVLIITFIIGYWTIESIENAEEQAKAALRQTAKLVSLEIDRVITEADQTSTVMAFSQQNDGLFGKRKETIQFASNILQKNKNFIGVSFGYKPNADQDDLLFLQNTDEYTAKGLSSTGRFIPYLTRNADNTTEIELEELQDIETSLYYVGVRNFFVNKGNTSTFVTEPYIYEGRMIVEHVTPIIREGKFVGIAGVDHSLEGIESIINEIKDREKTDVILISKNSNFIASTIDGIDLKTKNVNETPYSDLFDKLLSNVNIDQVVVATDPIEDGIYYYGMSRTDTADWKVIIRRSEAEVLLPIWFSFSAMFAVSLIGISLIVGIIFRFAKINSNRITNAMNVAEQLAVGDLQIDFHQDGGHGDEINAMFKSFNKLLKSGQEIETFCSSIALGDFSKKILPRSDRDYLIKSINIMSKMRRKAEKDLMERAEELRLTQNELVEAEKMSSLGNLVSGVAHEVNTPLGVGVTMASHIADELKEIKVKINSGQLSREELDEFIEDIDQGSHLLLQNLDRAATLISSFKQVAVDQSSEEKREILLSLKPKIKRTSVQVVIHKTEEDKPINTYPGALAQIFTNLVMNSITHGFENGDNKGRIDTYVTFKENWVIIEFKDNGVGMNSKIKDKIFDPFFTTKRGRGGSGLGLHIVYNLVVHQLNGKINCDSLEGEGATFIIEFPNSSIY